MEFDRAWMPSARAGSRMVPCGRWFDAVRVSGELGERAVAGLGMTSRGVVGDFARGVAMWLVFPGVADGWRLGEVEVWGAGQAVEVPPVSWVPGSGRGLRWLVRPRGDGLTEGAALYGALVAARGPSCGLGAQRCEPVAGRLVVVADIGGNRLVYACEPCVARYRLLPAAEHPVGARPGIRRAAR
ncbi:hypothetical protein [Streptomyces carpaticus]|uniref:Uncharacterized protein n=1 Tax=Streptomyces carpaticus TaxID=285558 RepID=A0ABV4ZKA7_9ACTN